MKPIRSFSHLVLLATLLAPACTVQDPDAEDTKELNEDDHRSNTNSDEAGTATGDGKAATDNARTATDEGSTGSEADDESDHDGGTVADEDGGAPIEGGAPVDDGLAEDAAAEDAGADKSIDVSRTRGPDGDLVVRLVAGNSHACALTAANEIKCWGANYYGQSGGNSNDNLMEATKIHASHGRIQDIYAGSDVTCLVEDDGIPRCFGRNLGLTDPTWEQMTTLAPTSLDGHNQGIIDMSLYAEHGCMVTDVGGIRCWGRDSFGLDTWIQTATVMDVVGMESGFTKVAVGEGRLQISHPNGGYEFGCGLLQTGRVKCWGFNGFGVLGFGIDDGQRVHDAHPPTDTINLEQAVDIDAGQSFACALTAAGGVKCWGSEELTGTGANARDLAGEGSLSDPFSDPSPTDVIGMTEGVTAIACGRLHTCTLMKDHGNVYCWGNNISGQVGLTTANGQVAVSALEATEVVGVDGATLIAAGPYHTCAAIKTGGVKCWGNIPGWSTGFSQSRVLEPMSVLGF